MHGTRTVLSPYLLMDVVQQAHVEGLLSVLTLLELSCEKTLQVHG